MGAAQLHPTGQPEFGRGGNDTDFLLQFPRGSHDRLFIAPDMAARQGLAPPV